MKLSDTPPQDEQTAETPEDQILVPARDAARMLSVSTRTLATMTREGQIQSVRARGRRLYRVVTLKRFAVENEK